VNEHVTTIDLQAVLDSSHEAFIVMDADGDVRVWNPAAEYIFGWRAEDAIGSKLSELIVPERYRTLHEQGLRTYLDTGDGPVLGTTIEIEGIDRLGRSIPVELTINPGVDGSGARVFHAFINDVTHRRRHERLSRASARVAWTLLDVGTGMSLEQVLEAIGEEMCFEVGLAWTAAADMRRIELRASWAPGVDAAGFVADSAIASFAPGIGLPGLCWESGEPLWSADVNHDARYVRRSEAQRRGLSSAIFIPICDDGACIGVLEFLSTEWRTARPELLAGFGELGARLGAILGHVAR
jgi:PAS domain S-box-containing protein